MPQTLQAALVADAKFVLLVSLATPLQQLAVRLFARRTTGALVP